MQVAKYQDLLNEPLQERGELTQDHPSDSFGA